ncbi:AraC family transcriptional regulator [Mucilaginibacter sp. UR6-11]|uniref:AraC family transcriptional regulator n=1 Tax=Mucilaginibacter sp. UR6-11 TaxID=1435644 RepID=UPI001E3618F4|nr:AraC family transcriptional regulator [Mucilaginibacter sp. UR6-11]MCC8424749.1 AraC family transcriptional regulator [Mucilaginibacter sp. UR6-11]
MNNITESNKKIKEGFVGQRMIVLPPNIKRIITNNPLIKNFYLTAVGYYPKAIYHDRERKTGSGQYILLYCVDGEGYIYLNDRTYTLKPNTFIIIPKNVGHRYKSSNSNPWSIYWVHFSGLNSDAIYHRSTEQNAPLVHSVPYDESRINLFEQLYAMLEHSFHEKEMEITNLYLQHFVTSLVYYKQLNPVAYDTDSVSASIAYMKKNLRKKFLIEDLASQCSKSVSHYSRLFHQKTGSSPINYFNLLKIQASCQHLYFTDRSIKEIAATLGFDDQYYFSRLFSKLIGMSPLKYRKTHKK